jgi:hypothetical protein
MLGGGLFFSESRHAARSEGHFTNPLRQPRQTPRYLPKKEEAPVILLPPPSSKTKSTQPEAQVTFHLPPFD